MGEDDGLVDLTVIGLLHTPQQTAPGVATHLHQLPAEQVLGTRQVLWQISHLTGEVPVAPL
ncbi:hypothetical protein D3C76_1805280 [compost metagenome]